MFKLALVALFCATAYARPNYEIDPHIVGGTQAQEGQFPFIVSLRLKSRGPFCGGALISDRYVVTAAHCVDGNKQALEIGAGSVDIYKQSIYAVDKVTVHQGYNSKQIVNDIALLRLKTPVKIGGNIQTITYPVTVDLNGKNVTGLGWGRTSSNGPASRMLLYLNRPILNNEECSKQLKHQLIDSQICLGSIKGHGMCFGDSGSPLLYKGADGKNYIAGVVSWGIPCAVGYPDVFTRVSSFVSWIQKNMV